uniref:PX domain-containing protein n=1 Tax=Otolemur garnettii TaxID=30611 RepID=H0XQD7_OTOGA
LHPFFPSTMVPNKMRSRRNKTKSHKTSLQEATYSSKPQQSYKELRQGEQEDGSDLRVAITDPGKAGGGMNAYVAYKVTAQMSLMFRSKQFAVKRRFSAFLGLYETLSEKHSQNGFMVPPPPEKSLMTKVKVGKEDSPSTEFLKNWRADLESYLQRTGSHPAMFQDPDVREFKKEELLRAVGTQTHTGAGPLKTSNKATDADSKMAIKMNESDIWFVEKLQEVEQHLGKLPAVVTIVNHGKEPAMNTAQFAESSPARELWEAPSQLAEVEEKIETLHQACNGFLLLAEVLRDYIRLLATLLAAHRRVKMWPGQQMLEPHCRGSRRLRLGYCGPRAWQAAEAKGEIVRWQSLHERDFEGIATVVGLKKQKEKSKDLKVHVIRYLELPLFMQQLAKDWEAFLPEARPLP